MFLCFVKMETQKIIATPSRINDSGIKLVECIYETRHTIKEVGGDVT